ncbi:helix-turn-helix domain-containing protein (plasmid) [Photobacterium sp. DA100]|uniref:AraC family transcriptional regulator n=1 Tax=Photobacterium sp. DA100 TaxID=3027472 RepID=UPI00247A2125|nr:AraC family transcriptional regulator [Photobacterium sp. DA100]WEM45192.1 helix-turn-helix domain-containing protein [Photobacterium sp. DA100]
MPLPESQFQAAFVRSIFFKPFIRALDKHYGITPDDLGVPLKLLNEPMTLVPFSDLNQKMAELEAVLGDQAYLSRMARDLNFSNMDHLGEWFLSTPELALSFRRINYGTSCLQSGASFHGELSGKIIKWTYDNHFSSGRGRFQDSLRIAAMFTNTLRYFMGESYHPLTVELSGPPCGNGELETFFGADIRWNAPSTRVWLDISILEHGNTFPFEVTRPMMLTNLELDEFLNMPQPHDAAKMMYEMINYSRFYGYPSLDFVAQRFNLSRQQLQRRLHQFGWSFSTITSYVLCNQAIKYMQADLSIKDIARELGYNNVQSFSKAFQRQRGQTPTQYKEKLMERSRSRRL